MALRRRNRELRIRSIRDLENAPRLENGAYNLQGANLQGANLEGVNLQGANLQGANLERTDLRDANLEGANLEHANFEDARLGGVNLQGANLRGAYMHYIEDAEHVIFAGANMEQIRIEYTAFIESNLVSANLRNANMIDVNLDSSDFTRADLRGATIRDVILTNCNLEQTDFTDAVIRNVDFGHARNIELARGIRIQRRAAPAPTPAPVDPTQSVWSQDEDCVGQEDPVSMEPIPTGRGFRLEAENRCYDALTLSEMRRLNRPLVGPMTRIPFTQNDIRRINEFRTANPTLRATGGKKRKTKITRRNKKTKMTRRNKKRRTLKRKNIRI